MAKLAIKGWLVLYNLLCMAGWAYVAYLTAESALTGHSPKKTWKRIRFPLKIVQTAAIMEVVHAVVGFVRSPVPATAMQVASRLLLLWGYTNNFARARTHFSLFLMVGSWALVEVPRYFFYVVAQLTDKVPYPLLLLRYSLFMILYPTGISGEMLQVWRALGPLKKNYLPYWYLTMLVFAIYIPGAPYMYLHMWRQRKRALAKASGVKKVEPPVQGVVWPKDATGERSSTNVNKEAWATAVGAANPEAAARVRKERSWRFGYSKHVTAHVRAACETPDAAVKIAKAGLEYMHSTFMFATEDGKEMPMNEAMNTLTAQSYEEGYIGGSGRLKDSLEVPYQPYRATYPYIPGKAPLTGDALKAKLEQWVEAGTIEPEARDAILWVANNPKSMNLREKYFVLLGAGSAMGPLQLLLSLGANIIAVDLNRPAIWERLFKLARESPGTLTYPLRKSKSEIPEGKEADFAGCNMLTETPQIRNWLRETARHKHLIIGGYAYLDGALHVQVAVAMDAIMASLCEKRNNTSLAFLCTPTDCHVVPADAHKAAKKSLAAAPIWQKVISAMFKNFLVPNPLKPVATPSGDLYLIDGIAGQQGPNYALAKRMQHWRAVVARSEGHTVSSNIAPSTATVSVVHNKQFEAAYGGMRLFKPIEVLYQETSNAVMGALLLHDVQNTANPSFPAVPLSNPMQLFSYGSFHGGVWRCAYKIGSIGEVAATSFYLKNALPYLLAVAGSVAAAAYGGVPPPHKWF